MFAASNSQFFPNLLPTGICSNLRLYTQRRVNHAQNPIAPSFLASLLSACTLPVYAKGSGYLFISSEKDNNITVLDGKTYEVVKRIGTEARPRHLQFNADKTQIYAAAGDGNAIDVIDVAKLELVDRIGEIDDPELFDLSADGKTMYISLEEDGALGILNLDEYFAKREGKPDLKVAEAAPEGDSSEAEDDAADNAEEDDSSSKKKKMMLCPA